MEGTYASATAPLGPHKGETNFHTYRLHVKPGGVVSFDDYMMPEAYERLIFKDGSWSDVGGQLVVKGSAKLVFKQEENSTALVMTGLFNQGPLRLEKQ